MSSALSPATLRIEEARSLLAKCRTIDEAKDIRDKAEAVRVYLRQKDASGQAQNDAAEIKVRAERRLGELLRDMRVRGERRAKQENLSKSHRGTSTPTLEDLGIEHNAAARWQAIARFPEERFEEVIAARRALPDGEITSRWLLSMARSENRTPRAAAEPRQDAVSCTADDPEWDEMGTVTEFYNSIANVAAAWPTDRSLVPLLNALRAWVVRLERREQERQNV